METEGFQQENLRRWKRALQKIFPVAIPEACSWIEIRDIVSLLNQVASPENLSHVFMPDSGGIHFRGAEPSSEDGCIDLLSDGSKYRLRPQSLGFQSFGSDHKWAYFRIEAGHLFPTGIYTEDELASRTGIWGNPVIKEVLTELDPYHHEVEDIWERGYLGFNQDGEEIPLPETAARVNRYFRGAFVVFAESSPYNQIASTYDARHAGMTSVRFRKYIENLIAELRARKEE